MEARCLNHTCFSGASESTSASTCEEHIEDCKVSAEDWLVQNSELHNDLTFVMFKVRRESVLVLHLPTTVMMTTTIMEPVLIKPIKLTKYTKQADQPQHKHGLIDQINLGKVVR